MTSALGTRDEVAAVAADLDTGRADVRSILRTLGRAGAFGGPDDDPTVALVAAVRLIRELAAASLAAAFSAWSQRMVVEYVRCCPLPHPMAGRIEALRTGEVAGATALAPAIADLAGHSALPVHAEPDGAGWRLSGTVRWASNLFDDALVVTPARTRAEGRLVVAFPRTALGVTPSPLYPLYQLSGLNGTGTGGLVLDDVAVGPDQVLSDDLGDFMALCRPTMLLLQAALAVGVADASLGHTATELLGDTTVLRSDHDAVVTQRDDVARRLEDTAADRLGAGPADLARLRLDAMDIAADAVRLESAASGGSGYLAASGTARRVREAAFLPVQAPTEVQLRRMLSR